MASAGLNFGDMLDAHAKYKTDADIALVHGDRQITWPQLNERSNCIARALLGAGVEYGDKAGFYLRNQPEYLEGLAACWKARLTHVNVNYRYVDDELVYILDNSDSAVVFFDVEFKDYVERIHDRLPDVKVWGQVGEGESVAEQTRDCLAKVDALLAQAGSDKEKILQTIIWLADMDDFAEMNAEWDAWVPKGHAPARATGEARLAAARYRVEIIVTAAC